MARLKSPEEAVMRASRSARVRGHVRFRSRPRGGRVERLEAEFGAACDEGSMALHTTLQREVASTARTRTYHVTQVLTVRNLLIFA